MSTAPAELTSLKDADVIDFKVDGVGEFALDMVGAVPVVEER